MPSTRSWLPRTARSFSPRLANQKHHGVGPRATSQRRRYHVPRLSERGRARVYLDVRKISSGEGSFASASAHASQSLSASVILAHTSACSLSTNGMMSVSRARRGLLLSRHGGGGEVLAAQGSEPSFRHSSRGYKHAVLQVKLHNIHYRAEIMESPGGSAAPHSREPMTAG